MNIGITIIEPLLKDSLTSAMRPKQLKQGTLSKPLTSYYTYMLCINYMYSCKYICKDYM